MLVAVERGPRALTGAAVRGTLVTKEADLTEEDLLTTAEAAKFLRVSPRTLYRLVKDGQLTPYRVGLGPNALLRFEKADLARLKQHKPPKKKRK